MKGFFILAVVCWMQTAQGINIPLQPLTQWGSEMVNTFSPKLNSLKKTYNQLVDNTNVITEIAEFPAALQNTVDGVKDIKNIVDKLISIITYAAAHPVLTKRAYVDIPQNQIQPYFTLFPNLEEDLNDIYNNAEELDNLLSQEIVAEARKQKIQGDTLYLKQETVQSAISLLQTLTKETAHISWIIASAAAKSSLQVGNKPSIMQYVNDFVGQISNKVQFVSNLIRDSSNAIKVGSPNAQGLVPVTFGQAVKTLNTYLVTLNPIFSSVQGDLSIVDILLGLANGIQ